MDIFSGRTPKPHPALNSRSASLQQWELLMQRGCAAVAAGRPDLALFSVRHALNTAQDLLQDGPAPEHADDCIAALVVAHHQLADLCLQLQRPEQAVDHLCQAHGALLQLLRGPASLALQQAAWRHSRASYAELLHYQSDHGPHPAITQLLHASSDPTGEGITVH